MKHNFYPVIHIKSRAHALGSAAIAKEAGADGVFLIDMENGNSPYLLDAYKGLLKLYKQNDFRVGVNFLCNLNLIPWSDLDYGTMLWSDTMNGYDFSYRKNIEFYAPFDFKYQRKPLNYSEELYSVEMESDVITTSGHATGEPPTLEKIQKIFYNVKKPIAIASGISESNVKQFKPYVRDFLVGTSIGYDTIDLEKTIRLARIIHE